MFGDKKFPVEYSWRFLRVFRKIYWGNWKQQNLLGNGITKEKKKDIIAQIKGLPVDAESKKFLIMWHLHLLENGTFMYQECPAEVALISFWEKHGKTIVQKNLADHFVSHLDNLLISQQIDQVTWQECFVMMVEY